MAQDLVPDVAIVGGGVVGIAAALSLQDAGYSVLLIDRDDPGAGCSAGNAGVMATSFVLPLSSFGHILAAPRMLMDGNAPLALPWRHVVEYAPMVMAVCSQRDAKQAAPFYRCAQATERSFP